jgi:hypothetical protein
MSSTNDQLDRPEFATVDLDIDVEEAQRHIGEAMKGLTAAESPEGTRYRTNDGMLVAVLGKRGSGSGQMKARLAYRTAPPSEPATRKAGKIHDALREHAIDA